MRCTFHSIQGLKSHRKRSHRAESFRLARTIFPFESTSGGECESESERSCREGDSLWEVSLRGGFRFERGFSFREGVVASREWAFTRRKQNSERRKLPTHSEGGGTLAENANPKHSPTLETIPNQ